MHFEKKLHIEEHEIPAEDSSNEMDLEAECEVLKKYFSTLDIVG